MIESPRGIRITDECRGLVLEKETWNVVSYPFIRFYNHGEGFAAPISFSPLPAIAEEKIDGSLVQLFYYKDKWRFTTRGKIDGLGELSDKSGGFNTFNDLISFAISKLNFEPFNTSYIYVFELVSPYNRVVTPYPEVALYLLDVKQIDKKGTITDIFHLTEMDKFAREVGCQRGKYHFVHSMEEVFSLLKSVPLTHEGFVVKSQDLLPKRIKVKSASYLALSQLFNNGTPNFDAIILKKEVDEFLTYYPEYKDAILDRKYKIDSFLYDLDILYQTNNYIESQRDFALIIKDYPGSFLVFNARKKEAASVFEIWRGMSLEDQMKTLEKCIK